MRVTARLGHIRARAAADGGFSLVLVLSVMLVTGLLLTAGFSAVNNSVGLTNTSASHTKAYYGALAGVQEYDYELEANPDYWETCESPSGEVEGVHYEVKVLPASTSKETTCNSTNPFSSAIQSKGSLANTFRIESTACAGPAKLTSCSGQPSAKMRKSSIVATFQVTGFLDYAYFTQYEDADPALYDKDLHQGECEKYYPRGGNCVTIEFAPEDSVKGPMHTDDAADICGNVEFGRKGEEPPDTVQMYGGNYSDCGDNGAIYYDATGKAEKGEIIEAPESDRSLKLYVEKENLLSGSTHLVLNEPEGKITVENQGKKYAIEWPKNGLLYVQGLSSAACNSTEYEQMGSDTASEPSEEAGCGTVYVRGTYSKSLTVAAENDLIINGNIMPYGVAATTPMTAPPGTATLGLIASEFVRIYHPVEETYKPGCKPGDKLVGSLCEYTNENESNGVARCDAPNKTSSDLNGPYIYAAMLSTNHSFLVDNYACGASLGYLNIYGAIAQKFRGIVGQPGTSGYLKDYNYDERLATDEPPYFLAPLKSGWTIIRETATSEG
jgi:Tfp pilus assembly protein PilX